MFSEICLSPRNSRFRGQPVFSEKNGENDKDFRRKLFDHGNQPRDSLFANNLSFRALYVWAGTINITIIILSAYPLLTIHISYFIIHTIVNSGCEKREAHINWSMVIPVKWQHPLLELP